MGARRHGKEGGTCPSLEKLKSVIAYSPKSVWTAATTMETRERKKTTQRMDPSDKSKLTLDFLLTLPGTLLVIVVGGGRNDPPPAGYAYMMPLFFPWRKTVSDCSTPTISFLYTIIELCVVVVVFWRDAGRVPQIWDWEGNANCLQILPYTT